MICKILKLWFIVAVLLSLSFSDTGFPPRELVWSEILVVEWPEPRHVDHPKETVPEHIQYRNWGYNMLILLTGVSLVVWFIGRNKEEELEGS